MASRRNKERKDGKGQLLRVPRAHGGEGTWEETDRGAGVPSDVWVNWSCEGTEWVCSGAEEKESETVPIFFCGRGR